MTTMRAQQILKRMMVHPNDKRTLQETVMGVYLIPCKDCLKVYTDEARRFGAMEKEPLKDVASIAEKKYTKAS